MSGADYLIIIVGLSIFALGIIAVVLLFGSIVSRGDERKKFIKMQAMSYTFIIVILMNLFDVALHLYYVLFTNTDVSSNVNNPVIELSIIAIIFLIVLFSTKKRFGD